MSVEGCMAKMTNYSIWLLVLVIFVIGLAPIFSGVAFAQMYNDADNPVGSMAIYAWGTAAVVVGITTGVGILTIVRKS